MGAKNEYPDEEEGAHHRGHGKTALAFVGYSWLLAVLGVLSMITGVFPVGLLFLGMAALGWLIGSLLALTALLAIAATMRSAGAARPSLLSLFLGAGPLALLAWGISELSHMSFSKGRVLRLNEGTRRRPDRARLPQRSLGSGWDAGLSLPTESLSTSERLVLGEAWLMAARMEQASVPAFARLSLKLVALGAPSELVERCHLAALDEIDHARRCYSVARAFSGLPWTAGALPALLPDPAAPPSFDRIDSLARLAAASLQDGALAEGTAARVAEVASQTAVLPVLHETLACIARDEQTHAELGWDILAWCLETGGRKVRSAIEQTLDTISEQRSPAMPPLPGISEAQLAAHGILSQSQLGQIAQETLRETQQRVSILLGESAAA